jgi:hypothetical protein
MRTADSVDGNVVPSVNGANVTVDGKVEAASFRPSSLPGWWASRAELT